MTDASVDELLELLRKSPSGYSHNFEQLDARCCAGEWPKAWLFDGTAVVADKMEVEHLTRQAVSAQQELSALRARCELLREYAVHKPNCDMRLTMQPDMHCTCGLDALRPAPPEGGRPLFEEVKRLRDGGACYCIYMTPGVDCANCAKMKEGGSDE